jgi:hypothetical protein
MYCRHGKTHRTADETRRAGTLSFASVARWTGPNISISGTADHSNGIPAAILVNATNQPKRDGKEKRSILRKKRSMLRIVMFPSWQQ